MMLLLGDSSCSSCCGLLAVVILVLVATGTAVPSVLFILILEDFGEETVDNLLRLRR